MAHKRTAKRIISLLLTFMVAFGAAGFNGKGVQVQAAQKAGIGLTTLKRYLDEPEFQTAYQKAVTKLLEEASVQAKQGLSPALSCLREIVEDRKTAATARIQAARSLLEYGLRLTETVDVMKQLNELEQWRDKVDGND